ncbi:MAG: hypothetical protein Q8R45_11405 [Brevundimonas sp.]|uniref:hypothetical protein n=1 Tax=Brevundimonas sp. TaxID=1871086 RepID=UPI002732FA60|nr:hypothetical protein [Brevundimonas sp.]MDP3657559.1 hypothetical protein [Brevundimonas sp.]
MPVLRHEALEFEARGGASFGRASIEGRRTLEKIDGPGQLIHVIYAATYQEAMQAHYDRLGWGQYKPMPGVTDRPYDQDELERQLVEYPADAELRRLNGLAT